MICVEHVTHNDDYAEAQNAAAATSGADLAARSDAGVGEPELAGVAAVSESEV